MFNMLIIAQSLKSVSVFSLAILLFLSTKLTNLVEKVQEKNFESIDSKFFLN